MKVSKEYFDDIREESFPWRRRPIVVKFPRQDQLTYRRKKMTFKPPHSEFSKAFTNAEGTKRINRENKAARDAYNRGKNFERGRKDA